MSDKWEIGISIGQADLWNWGMQLSVRFPRKNLKKNGYKRK